MTDIKALREEFASLHTDNSKLIASVAAEKRAFSGEETATKEKRFSRMDEIKSIIDDSIKMAGYALENGTADLPVEPKGKQEFMAEMSQKQEFSVEAYRAAVNTYARTGDTRRLFALISTSESGALLPKAVLQPEIVRANANPFRAALAAYGYLPISRTMISGVSLPVFAMAAGAAQAQDATSGTAVDPTTTGSLSLAPTLYTSKQMWWANTVVNAQDFDVFAYTVPGLQQALDRGQHAAWMTAAKSSVTTNNYASLDDLTVSYTDLINWEHSVPASYRWDMAFIVSDSLYKALRGIVDDQGRPVMDLDPANAFQSRIHGKPVFVSENIDAIAASKKVGLAISAGAIKVLDAGLPRLVRYVLAPSNPDQTGFELFQNGDCGLIEQAASWFVTHATN